MSKVAGIVAGVLIPLAASGAALAQQQSGMVGSGAPEDVVLEVTLAAEGLTLSQDEFRLALGGYYRFNFVCPAGLENEAGISFRAPELLENAHLRILSVSNPEDNTEVNFHVQGLNFRQIDCEGVTGSARFSFHPMRAGTYPFVVALDADETQEATGQFVVE
jgi:hypothetical protein